PSKVTDVEIFKHRQDLSGQDYEQSKEILLRNSLNVLLRRGIKGMYLHAHDPKLESYLEKMIQK
ncbi:DNA/RNA helicase domain-containing protein, partial [Lentilactobacillus hilgardii]